MSHSESLAKGTVELTFIMAPSVKIASVGDMGGGGFGTGSEKIQATIESVYPNDRVLVLVDLRSAVVTTKVAIRMFGEKKVEMVDCPLMEGAVVTTIDAVGGMSFEDIKTALAEVDKTEKFQRVPRSDIRACSGT